MTEQYFKVNVQYLQVSDLLVVADTAEDAKKMVADNVLEGTQGFQINSVGPLTDEEKEQVIKSIQGMPQEAEPERTLN